MKYIILMFSMLFLLTACKKEPGFGGNASVKGVVWVKSYNGTFTYLYGEFPGADADVYLKAENQIAPLDRIKTNYNGQFEFPFLYKGKYEVYTYSKDSSLNAIPGASKTILKAFEITQNREIVDLDTLIILD
ncbi:MAG: hypothetical protein K1X92_12960 [Bacteroidia bacterium]|nr:hypothetical protein [Bacteroidia bacterium]